MMGSTSLSGQPNRKIWIALSSLAGLVVWQLASTLVAREIILPSPRDTLLYLVALFGRADTWLAMAATVRRVLVSFLLNIVFALAAGIASGFSRRTALALTPLVTVVKSVPTMGVILLSLIWFNSETAVVFVCTLIVFPVLYTAVFSGIRHLDRGLLGMHRVFRISRARMLLHFVLPSLRPHIVAGVSSGVALSMKVIIAAEVLSQPRTGIGTMFQIERARLNTTGVFAWSLLVILITGVFDLVFDLWRRHRGTTE